MFMTGNMESTLHTDILICLEERMMSQALAIDNY